MPSRLCSAAALLLLAAVTDKPAIAQPASHGVTHSAAMSPAVSRIFPFQIGNRWVYRVRGEEAVGAENQTIRTNGSYIDTVTAIETVGRVQTVEIRSEGSVALHVFCNSDEAKDRRFWFIIDRDWVFLRCGKDEAMQFAKALNSDPTMAPADASVEFVLPLEEGDSWGADPEMLPRDDAFYQWNVDEKRASAIHGRFHDCYVVSYRTIGSDEERTVCAGTGLASDEFHHHGSTDDYSIELVSFTRRR